MSLSTPCQVIGGIHAVRYFHNIGGHLTARRGHLNNGLGSQPKDPHIRHSVGSGSLLGSLFSSFSTSASVLAKPEKKSQISLATILNRKLEALDKPKPKLRMIGEPNTKTESTPASPRSALDEVLDRHNTLHQKFYETVAEEDDRLWLRPDAIRGIPSGIWANWDFPPMKNHDHKRIGVRRRFGQISSATAWAEVPSTRQKLTQWDENACHELIPFFKDLIKMRATIARLKGFKNFFELSSQNKMLDQKSVESFLNELKDKITPRVHSYMEDLLEMKLRDMHFQSSFTKLRHELKYHKQTIWDFQEFYGADYQLHWGEVSYYARLHKEKNVWGGEIGHFIEYFELKSTVRKLLPVFGHVFGISFTEIAPDGLHSQQYTNVVSTYLEREKLSSKIFDRGERLLIFNVYDTTPLRRGAPLGVLVLDLIKRDRKVLNAFCRKFATQNYNVGGSNKSTPAVVIQANFQPPWSKGPSLLGHGDLETLAHELGHAIHHFVRGSLVGVPWDAVEIPSHLLEHWVSDPRILQKLSSHYVNQDEAYLAAWKAESPSKPLPPEQAPLDTFDPIVLSRHPGNRISEYQGLLWLSKFDLLVHSYSEKELESADLGVDCQKVLREWTGIFGPKLGSRKNNTYLTWDALDGYQASHYTYPFALVYTVDIFDKYFARDPMSRRHGLRFRRIFLEHRDYFPSRAKAYEYKSDPSRRRRLFWKLWFRDQPENTMDALVKFMGRELSMKPFLKALNAPLKSRKPFWERMRAKLVNGMGNKI